MLDVDEPQEDSASLRGDKEELGRDNQRLQAQSEELKQVHVELSKVPKSSWNKKKKVVHKENEALVLKVADLHGENEVQQVLKEWAAEKKRLDQKDKNRTRTPEHDVQDCPSYCDELRRENEYLKKQHAAVQQAFCERDRRFQSANDALREERRALQTELQETAQVLERLTKEHETLRRWTDSKSLLIHIQKEEICRLTKELHQMKDSYRQAQRLRDVALQQDLRHCYIHMSHQTRFLEELNVALKIRVKKLNERLYEQQAVKRNSEISWKSPNTSARPGKR